MSKSEGTAVWLAPDMTSPYEFYQYWINTPDSQVSQFLRFFTFLERQRIEELEAELAEDPAKREAQKVLAWEVTALVHGEAEAQRVRNASEALFDEEIAGLGESSLLEILAEAPTSDVPRSRLIGGVSLVELLTETGLTPSKSAARTDISSGGAYINNRREADPEHRVGAGDLLHNKYLVLRRGRKTYHLVRAV